MVTASGSSLWIDAIPRRLHITSIAERLAGRPRFGAYLFVVLATGLDAALSVVVAWRTGSPPPLLENPFWLLLPVTLLFVVWSIRKFDAWLASIATNVDVDSRTASEFETEVFERFVSGRLRLGIYATAIILYAGTYFVRGTIPEIVAELGFVVAFLKFGVIIPLAYVPIAAEFAAVFIDIHVRLPRVIRRSEMALDFSDPTDFGGMYQFGAIVKYSYYIFAAVTLLFLSWTYAAVLFSKFVGTTYSAPGMETTVQFAALWLLGTGLLAHSVFQFHVHMAEQKEAKLREVTDRIRDLTDDPHTIPDVQPAGDEVERVRLEYDHLRRVRQVREYPIDFVMVSQLVFSILLPLAVERLFNALV